MNIFCYGSLMWLDLWQHEVRNEYAVKDALVKGYRCRRVKGSFEPALVRAPVANDDNEIVEGKLYLDVSDSDFQRIADYHGDNYQDISAVCFTREQEVSISTKLFLWRSEHRALLATDDWEKQWFEEKALLDYRKKINQSLL